MNPNILAQYFIEKLCWLKNSITDTEYKRNDNVPDKLSDMPFTRYTRTYKSFHNAIKTSADIFVTSYLKELRKRLRVLMKDIEQPNKLKQTKFVYIDTYGQITTLGNALRVLYHNNQISICAKRVIDIEISNFVSKIKYLKDIHAQYDEAATDRLAIPVAFGNICVEIEVKKAKIRNLLAALRRLVDPITCNIKPLLTSITSQQSIWPIRVQPMLIPVLIDIAQFTLEVVQLLAPIFEHVPQKLKMSEHTFNFDYVRDKIQSKISESDSSIGTGKCFIIPGIEPRTYAQILTSVYSGEFILFVSLLSREYHIPATLSLLSMLYVVTGLRLFAITSALLYALDKSKYVEMQIQTEDGEILARFPLSNIKPEMIVYRQIGYLV